MGRGLPVIHGYKPGDKCPAKAFYDDCNYCFCIGGFAAGCTKMLCPSSSKRNVRSVVVTSIPHNDFFDITSECVPGQQFYNKCNSCYCSTNGKDALCTLMGCGEPEHPRIDEYQKGMKCPAGQTFYDRCNACNCGPDGRTAACTLKACPEEQ